MHQPAPALPESVVIEELALRHYAERSGSEEVRVAGRAVTFSLRQPLFAADGRPLGVADLTLAGTRDFGRRVRLCTAPAILLTDPVPPEELVSLEGLGREVVRTLLDLCTCGTSRAACDCCEACDGQGLQPGEAGARTCPACRGRGYAAGTLPRPA